MIQYGVKCLSFQDVAGTGAGADVEEGHGEDLDDEEAMEGS
jgi:hypothetical protein